MERGLPGHLVSHLVTMAELHRAGRYDRLSDDVLALTGQGPLGVQELVRRNAATFTTPDRDRRPEPIQSIRDRRSEGGHDEQR